MYATEQGPTAGRPPSSEPNGDDGVIVRHEEPATGCGIGCAELIAVLLVIAVSAAIVLLLGI